MDLFEEKGCMVEGLYCSGDRGPLDSYTSTQRATQERPHEMLLSARIPEKASKYY